MRTALTAVLVWSVVACGERGVDWSAPESVLLDEEVSEEGDAVKLAYASLLDAPCKALYDALADVEHYPDFIPGVHSVQIVAQTANTKTVLIAQQVINRTASAKTEWRFDPGPPLVEFKTLTSDTSLNDGRHVFEPSPDGKRCLVRSTFLVKAAPGGSPPSRGALEQATHDSFLAGMGGVKKRAVGAK